MRAKFSLSLAVRKLCRRQGLYLNQFAKKAAISKSTLHEAMKYNSPKLETCERCAEGFGLTLAEFIAEGYPTVGVRKMHSAINDKGGTQ
ncbi:helix-turn-helix domain-containing protein [Pantoea allii]|uniref:helix-turn-helix domain-containing protein n=1 Tax=Pantoea allii TaxID=574096 RepID=UPI003D78CA29